MALLFLVGFYYEHPIKKYCDGLEIGTGFAEASIDAKEEGFYTNDSHNLKDGVTYIHNHMAPFFIVGCVVELKAGKIIKKEVLSTD